MRQTHSVSVSLSLGRQRRTNRAASRCIAFYSWTGVAVSRVTRINRFCTLRERCDGDMRMALNLEMDEGLIELLYEKQPNPCTHTLSRMIVKWTKLCTRNICRHIRQGNHKKTTEHHDHRIDCEWWSKAIQSDTLDRAIEVRVNCKHADFFGSLN